MKKYWVFKLIKGLVFITLAIIVFGYIVMWLWNGLVPNLFHGPMLTFCQAIGLLILAKLLFGGFHGGKCWGHGGWQRRKQYWKEKMEARMANMTPEEKEKFREQMRMRCGGKWSGFDSEEEKSGDKV